MTRPTRRADSSHFQFQRRVPKDLQPRLKGQRITFTFPPMGDEPEHSVTVTAGQHVKFSLRARDPAVAKARTGLAESRLASVYDAHRNGPRPITHRQLVALSGEAFRLYVQRFGNEPGGDPEFWIAFKAVNRAVYEGRVAWGPPADTERLPERDLSFAREAFGRALTDTINSLPRSTFNGLESRFGEVADDILTMHGVMLLPDDRSRFLLMVGVAMNDAGRVLRQRARFDYSEEATGKRFPAIEATAPPVTMVDVFNKWKTERKPPASTLSTWGGIMRSFSAHIGAKSLRDVSPEDVIGWKDKLLGGDKPLSTKTVRDSHLSAIRTLFNFAVANRMMSANPAAEVRVLHRPRPGEAHYGYDGEQVTRLLQLAAAETHPCRRWLIPLAAFSGSRIGEVAQLWGARIVTLSGLPVMQIRPAEDAGSIKTTVSDRDVPIHSSLIEAGFLDFVAKMGNGPLFYRRSSGNPERMHATKSVTNRQGGWIRENGFTNPLQDPNHALRHWFMGAGQPLGIPDSVVNAIAGSAGTSISDRVYRGRGPDMATKSAAIDRIARSVLP